MGGKEEMSCKHWQIRTDTYLGTETIQVYIYICVLCGRINPDCTNYEGFKHETQIRRRILSK